MTDHQPLSRQLRRDALTARPPMLPNTSSLAAAALRIAERWPTTVPTPQERDKEQLVQLMLARLRASQWDGARLSQVLQAAAALFDQDRRSRLDLEDLRRFYYAEIVASDQTTFVSAMADIYLDSFDPTGRHTRAMANSLGRVVPRLNARWRKLAEVVPEIFDQNRAAAALAARMCEMERPYAGLRDIGLRTPHSSGLLDYVHDLYVSYLSPSLASPDTVEKLLAWLCPPGRQPRTSGADIAISAILEPWRDDEPPSHFRSHLVERLTTLYGDPRTSASGVWSSVSPAEMDTMMRWLTGENIRFFLDVVSEVETSHMWAPRRRFWLGLYEQGRIDGAWVAFSEAAAKVARVKSGTEGGSIGYGIQTARASRLHTSLLILKIANKIVVEGSHNYKIHIFGSANDDTPSLYGRRYDAERIRLLRHAKSKSHNGDWQGWVMERI